MYTFSVGNIYLHINIQNLPPRGPMILLGSSPIKPTREEKDRKKQIMKRLNGATSEEGSSFLTFSMYTTQLQ